MRADIFAYPSSDEGFGISILEAISKNIPVVAMNHSGVSDIIEHGVNGYLTDNFTGFSSCLQSLIENPDLRAEFSQKAAERLPKYNWGSIYEQTFSVCTGVCTDVINGNHQNNNSGQKDSSGNGFKRF